MVLYQSYARTPRNTCVTGTVCGVCLGWYDAHSFEKTIPARNPCFRAAAGLFPAMNNPRAHSDPPSNLLLNRRFVFLWCAYAVSALGDHLSEMAILKTQNALDPGVDITPLTARMTFVFFLPFALLASVAGMLADRLPRTWLMMGADLARSLLLFFFPVMIAWTQGWAGWGAFVPLFFVGIFAAMFSPARSALLPTLIRPEQLVRANALLSGLGIIATMAAAKIGGVLADRYEPSVAFNLNSGTFLLSAMFVFFIGTRGASAPQHQRTDGSSLGDLRAGFRYALAHRYIWELLLLASLIWFAAPLVNSVIPAVVRDVYHGSYSDISGYRAKLGAGFVLGALILFMLGEALRSQVALTWGFMVAGLFLFVFAASAYLDLSTTTLEWIGTVGVIGAGVGAQVVMASLYSLLQRTVSNRYRGRIFGTLDFVTTCALLIATGMLSIPHWPRMDEWVGCILLGAATLTLACGFLASWIRLGRSHHGRLVQFAYNLNDFVAKFWWGFQRIGRSTVPLTGPVIIAANHRCPADPLFLSAASPQRKMAFLVAREFFQWRLVRMADRRLTPCIPVNRTGNDAAAFKGALRHLREGGMLGIFIEGGIVEPNQQPRPRDGVAMLALRTGATVIPAHISGTRYFHNMVWGLLSRHRARVQFGPPVDLTDLRDGADSREDIRKATQKIYAAIMAMSPESVPRPLGSGQGSA